MTNSHKSIKTHLSNNLCHGKSCTFHKNLLIYNDIKALPSNTTSNSINHINAHIYVPANQQIISPSFTRHPVYSFFLLFILFLYINYITQKTWAYFWFSLICFQLLNKGSFAKTFCAMNKTLNTLWEWAECSMEEVANTMNIKQHYWIKVKWCPLLLCCATTTTLPKLNAVFVVFLEFLIFFNIFWLARSNPWKMMAIRDTHNFHKTYKFHKFATVSPRSCPKNLSRNWRKYAKI